MANSSLTLDIVFKEAKREFVNNTPFLSSIRKEYDGSYKDHGASSGDTIRIKRPQRNTTRTTKQMQVQDNVEESVSLARSNWLGIDLKFSQAELALDIDAFSDLYIKPQVATAAAELEYLLLTKAYQETYNQTGTPGTDPATVGAILDANQKLSEYATPVDGNRNIIVSPAGEAASVGGFSALFNSTSHIAKQYVKGKMGTALGFDWAMSQGINRHTRGGADANYTIDGASQTGASILTADGSGTFTVGDVITIAGVNAVNPQTKKDLGYVQQFVINTASAGGTVTLQISPSIITSGQNQTVTASPDDDAVITVLATASTDYAMHMAYHKNAFAFGSVDIALPKNAEYARRNNENGLSMSMIRDYDIINNDTYCRLDILWGMVTVVPEHSCRLIGA